MSIHPSHSGASLPDSQRILKQLGSRNPRESIAAERTLRSMGPAGASLLIAFLQQEKPNNSNRFRTGLFVYIFAVGVVTMTIVLLTHHGRLMGMGIVPGIIVSTSLVGAARRTISRPQQQAATLLATFEDRRAVGSLLDALSYPAKRVRQAAAIGLIALLPCLRASDAALLDEEARKHLNSILAGANTDLVLAALIALEQVGDASALPNVKRLANGKGLAAKEARIQDAAQTCLLSLQQRTEERTGQTLLRPSRAGADTLLLPAASAVNTHSDELMRPASGVHNTQDQVLLRASSDVVETTS